MGGELVCGYCGSKRQYVCWCCYELDREEIERRIGELEEEVKKLKAELENLKGSR